VLDILLMLSFPVGEHTYEIPSRKITGHRNPAVVGNKSDGLGVSVLIALTAPSFPF
jgi:hypothetical protein